MPVRLGSAVQRWLVHRWQHFVLPRRLRRHLAVLVRAAERADRFHQQALRLGWFRADQRHAVSEGKGLPGDASALLNAAVGTQIEAYARLREARLQAAAELAAVGSYPHQIDRTLSAADAALPNAPGADRPPPSVEARLREITAELNGIRARLDRLDTLLTSLEVRLAPLGHGVAREQLEIAIRNVEKQRDEVRIAARLMLVRHDLNEAEAWRSKEREQSKLYRTFSGWTVMETARLAKEKLLEAHAGIRDVRVAPEPATDAVIPHPDWAAHPHGDYDRAEGDMSAATRRGRPNRSNQDAATLVLLPGGDRVAVVVDGVYSYPGSRDAAQVFIKAYRAELEDDSGRTPEQALRHAHESARNALTAAYSRGSGHQAVAYMASYESGDGSVTTSHVGTARAYWLSAADPAGSVQWSEDHTRGGSIVDGGIMTRYLASDFHPEPTIRTHRPAGPGMVVIVTDGLWRYLPTPQELAGVIADGHVAEAAGRLADAAHLAGGVDDLTAAVVPVGSRGPTEPGRAGAPAPTGAGDDFVHCTQCGEIHWGRDGAVPTEDVSDLNLPPRLRCEVAGRTERVAG